MLESMLYDKLDKNKVRCRICQVRCVISKGKRGACLTRINEDGTLYTMIYGVTSSVCVDSIEKKPLYHFYPGTKILSMGTRGCNFKCPGCQNWEISHDSPDELGRNMEKLTPADSVALAKRLGCHGIGWTYNDPSIWLEHTLEAAQRAREEGFYSAYMTNGYATPEALDAIGPYLTAYRVDIKAFSRGSYKDISGLGRFEEILEVTKRAKFHWNMHVECVTNITPTINDDEKLLRDMARWIKNDLGEFTPWHVTRFYPYLDLSHIPPTPVKTLERVYEIGREEGLKYVYVGNLPGHPWEDTYCHHCGECIIKRRGFAVAQAKLVDGKCPHCHTDIPGRWQDRIESSTGERIPVLHT